MCSFPRRRGVFVAALLFALSLQAGLSAPKTAPLKPLLPADFAGWRLTAPAVDRVEPEAADAANADVLREYGFQRFEQGDYAQEDNRLAVRVLMFPDATGAYGAYTFYRRSGMPKEEIGRGGASYNNRVLFWVGNTVVDATFDHISAMSAAQLRELARALPQPGGTAGIPPPLPGYLPQAMLEGQTTHYALGEAGYTRSGGALPPGLVDFSKGAETLTANYAAPSGEGALTLIGYPTPQIAAERERAIEASFKAGNTPQAAWPQALAESNPAALSVRRSGPLLVVTSGDFSSDDAQKIARRVNYSAEVTWDHPQGYVSEVSKTARLLVGIATLTGVLAGSAVLMGLFLGGGRVLYRRLRGKPASTLEEDQFITLNLKDR